MLDEAFELAKKLAKNPGWVFIPPFDDPLIWYVEPRLPGVGSVPLLHRRVGTCHLTMHSSGTCVHAHAITQKHTHACSNSRSPRP